MPRLRLLIVHQDCLLSFRGKSNEVSFSKEIIATTTKGSKVDIVVPEKSCKKNIIKRVSNKTAETEILENRRDFPYGSIVSINGRDMDQFR